MKFLKPNCTEWEDISPDITGLELDEAAVREARLSSEKNLRELKDFLIASLQIQNISVLAGSGTSLGADGPGGPSMRDLWKISAVDQATGQLIPAITTASQKVRFNPEVENPNIEEFLSSCEAYLQVISDDDMDTLVKDIKVKILTACDFVNDKTNLESHKKFVHRLSRRRTRDSRLKLFTTNYDACFERAAGMLGLVVIDGFSYSQPRYYDPRFFGYDIVRRSKAGDEMGAYLEGVIQLFKLHGSVTWVRQGKEIVECISPSPDHACLIFPAKGKYQQSYIQPHLELMSQFLLSLRDQNSCVITIGFGFNDDHLSEPIIAAVKSNPHFRLIVVDANSKINHENLDNCSPYWKQLFDMSFQGEDVWFINANFSDFSSLIPDLRSLSQAERLVKNIKSLVIGD